MVSAEGVGSASVLEQPAVLWRPYDIIRELGSRVAESAITKHRMTEQRLVLLEL